MYLDEQLAETLRKFIRLAAERNPVPGDYGELCECVGVAKMYYDMDLGDNGRYRNHKTQQLVLPGYEQGGKIMLYDSGEKSSGETMMFPYYYEGKEYVHAFIEFREGFDPGAISKEIYNLLSDVIYIIGSRVNMRYMLDYAETTDPQSGIPNVVYIKKKFEQITKTVPPERFVILYINLQNFKYINESASSKAGDEAVVKYARTIVNFIEEDECVCRMGGDNFVMFIHKEHLGRVTSQLRSVTIGKLANAPGRTFEISAWIGVSDSVPDDDRSFSSRLNEAAIACNIGKTRLKVDLVFFSEELKLMMNRGREIMAMFYPAVKNHEFHPFFQAKVDMRTGELVGFEALCRWIHDGHFIYPDQFIPVLDKEGLIHELDMAIFRETCAAIKKWKDMGLRPPRISTNFSRKNLFVSDIEDKICAAISDNGISADDVEVEITESVQEAETTRLIEFVKKLKDNGIHISIDDFGTGYSSLMLIHNIDADVVKIDKSFVDAIPGDRRSEVLIESVIGIANNLGMSLIAEGVETAEQGKALLKLGCCNAQGYYYSKPVDFDEATGIIRDNPFKPIS